MFIMTMIPNDGPHCDATSSLDDVEGMAATGARVGGEHSSADGCSTALPSIYRTHDLHCPHPSCRSTNGPKLKSLPKEVSDMETW